MNASKHASRARMLNEHGSLIGDQDLFYFNEGTHARLYDVLGSHRAQKDGVEGVHFAVWAPNARAVSVIGDFNQWRPRELKLNPRASSGIWEGFAPGLDVGALYKYQIDSHAHGGLIEKADPLALRAEVPPRSASVVADLNYEWRDDAWMQTRAKRNAMDAPISIYEVHLGSWMRVLEDNGRPLNYRELAEKLTAHVRAMGFTHVEFMPIMEHPFGGSWGYQVTGYFAASSRFGTPQDLMFLIDTLHQAGIGVILDWVPSHFPTDGHGLAFFDGTHLYEHADEREGFHPDWKSAIFNYGRHEVVSFLLSSACFWLDRYHADGLRVDGVASMLYRDYSRKQGQWIPNRYGGRQNLEAIAFLRRLNETTYFQFPDTMTLAEESTDWPMVSRPTSVGGLGFGYKWDMGWMHDTLKYFAVDSIFRKHHQSQLTFRMMYAFNENFVLSLSHDEVVHGKRSLIDKMPGDRWQKFANLRLLFGYMYGQPGKKLIFMGGEIGQWGEWNHDASVEWHLLREPDHLGLKQWVADLNNAYWRMPDLHEGDCVPSGFEWIDFADADNSILSFLRKGKGPSRVLVVCNLTPVVRHNYQLGVPLLGEWREILNSDAEVYGGSGVGNQGLVRAQSTPHHGRPYSISVTLPPLSTVFFHSNG